MRSWKSKPLPWWTKILVPLLGLGLVLLSAANGVTVAQTRTEAKRDTVRLPNPRGAMIRSILVPGWGQWYNGKKRKAAVVFAVESGLVARALYQNYLASKTADPEERFVYIDRRNQALWWLAGAILLSSLDAYVDAQLAGFDVGPDLSWKPSAGFCLGAKVRVDLAGGFNLIRQARGFPARYGR